MFVVVGPLKGQDSCGLQDLRPTGRDKAIRKSWTEDINGRTGRVGEGGEEVRALERCRLRAPMGRRCAADGRILDDSGRIRLKKTLEHKQQTDGD